MVTYSDFHICLLLDGNLSKCKINTEKQILQIVKSFCMTQTQTLSPWLQQYFAVCLPCLKKHELKTEVSAKYNTIGLDKMKTFLRATNTKLLKRQFL